MTALERLSRWRVSGIAVGAEAARLVVILCATQFLLWYGIHAFGDNEPFRSVRPYDGWNVVNHDDPQGRVGAGFSRLFFRAVIERELCLQR